MKKVYIIHGWSGRPESAWFPWLEKQLTDKGFEVYIPAMPDPDHPKLDVWIQYIETFADGVDENTFFVGHSSGCQAILRYIERLPEEAKIGGCVFVAGWFNIMNLETDEDREIAKPWTERLIDYGKVKQHIKNMVAIFSENDPYVSMENRIIFEEDLGCKIVNVGHKGHLDEDDGITELPEALDELLRIAK